MKRRLALAWFLLGSTLILIPLTVFLKAAASNSISRAVVPGLARLGDRAAIHAEGRGAPRINLADGHEIVTAYAGAPEAQRLLEQNLVQPLAMASSDFDGDGVPDLVSGYAAPNGGMLTLHRGNVDAIYPHTLEAQQRKADGAFTDAPFLSPARAFETPQPVDFIGCGDFDSDGSQDIVSAARGSAALSLFLGDGHGNLSEPKTIELPGRVTAMVTGDANGRIGPPVLAIAVTAANGAGLLVFESSPELASPKTIELPSDASAMIFGRLYDDFESQLVVAAGKSLTVIRQGAVGIANRALTISTRSFPFSIRSLAGGDFTGDYRTDLLILTGDGELRVLSRPSKPSSATIDGWASEVAASGQWPRGAGLLSARVSSLPHDTAIVVDPEGRQLALFTCGATSAMDDVATINAALDVEGQPVAVLPMRLNTDALSDLVVLTRGRTAPAFLLTAPANTFTVTNNNDTGAGSLRDAIVQANAAIGADLINFNSGLGTINVGGSTGLPLPDITDAVTIDGGSPRVELNGAAAGSAANGLGIFTDSVVVQGLVINRFSGNGILISAGGAIVQGNFIGTDAAGAAARGNATGGVLVGRSANTIGGTVSAARNVISGNNLFGVTCDGKPAHNNNVLGNFIGTDSSGAGPLGNTGSGVILSGFASDNVLGGTVAGDGNIIAFNGGTGVEIDGVGNAVLSNSIFSNQGLGIDLFNDDGGVTQNDDCDGDFGANNLQNFPELTAANSGGASTTIMGRLNSSPSTTFRIEFFSSTGCDESGNGEGRTFIGSTDVMTDSMCNANITVVLPVSVPAGQVITATATAPSGDTSEFSACVTVIGPPADLAINKSDSPDPVSAGANVTYTINFVNNGPGDAQTVTVTDATPANTTFVSAAVTTGSGWGTSAPAVGGTGNVVFSKPTVAALETAVFTIVVKVDPSTPDGTLITNTATAATTTTDSNPSNNSASTSTVVAVLADLAVTKSDSPDPVGAGANITYTINFVNNGPSDAQTVTVTDATPANTTFVSATVTTGSGWSTSAPAVGGTGNVVFSKPKDTAAAGETAVFTVVVKVNPGTPGGTLITNTATAATTTTDPTPGNNSATATTAVISACALTCPPDFAVFTSPTATTCAAVVTFAPATSEGCGTVTCTPPSGSVFAVGTTTVSCTLEGGPRCSFNVTVVDDTPPSIITCPTGVTVPLPAGQLSAVVNYPAATATDNCSVASVGCVPPSGSVFPAGATLITCTATDPSGNSNRCFFFVTVLDAEPPVIRCPANVSASPPAGQTSAVVNYPPPTVTDNLPGVNVVCTPASGSSFPAGATTVTCTATDAGGNRSSCSFIVGVGGPQAKVNIPGNKIAVEFATASATRKPPKPKNNPCSFLTIENIGFSPLVLTFDSIARTGSAVDSGRITDPDDTRFFSLSRVNSDQSLTPLDIGAVLTVQPGQVQNLCAKFAALTPALAGKTAGLAASNVLPDTVTSKMVFRQNAGANIAVPLLARVSTALVLVNLVNPRRPPEVIFTRSGDNITVSYAVFDSNLDVSRAKYEFLNSSGQVVAGPFEIDLTASISSANLVRGQSFSVDQNFTGASNNPDITGVRLTVFDGETSVAVSTSSATSISAASIQLVNRTRRVTLYPPDVKLRPQLP